MEDQRHLDAKTLEGIDACRPGQQDLREPELADVARSVIENERAAVFYERVQRADHAFATAMHDLSVPADLKAKLLARLHVTEVAIPVAAEKTLSVSAEHDVIRRRSWLPIALAVAVLVVASFGLMRIWRPSGNVDVVTLADVWQQQLADGWRPMAKAPDARALPTILGVVPRAWQPTAAFQGYRGAAYDVSRRGSRAVLFIVNVAPDGELPTAPPEIPQFSSGGRALAAWTVGQRMCLLVVEGDLRAYQSLIRRGAGPLA
jgi:hypothetical protein